MKILVYGSKGWIGGQFIEIMKKTDLVECVDFVLGTARVNNIQALKKEIEDTEPTHIISFIGRTHGTIGDKKYTTIDYLEQKGKINDNVRDNLFSPISLALICKDKGIHYTYLGTGCIFKFDEEHPFGKSENGFTENSLPNFFGSGYSIVKGYTDQLMHFFENSVLNLRIRMPITGEVNGRNFITKITTYENICSIPNSMTVLPELLPKVLDMMKKNVTGTLNLTNPGLISHNEMLEMFRDIVDPEFVWNNFSVEEQAKILESDRSNNFLDTTRLQELYPDVKTIKESVRDMMIQYRESYHKYTNLLITGGCGFIGSNFINLIGKQDKYNIVNVDAMYYCAEEKNIDQSIRNNNHYTLIKGDLSDPNLNLRKILKKYRITHVIHFAAQSHVQNSFSDSLQYTQDNIVGSHMLLEAARLYGKITKFIHVSTDEVYGESINRVDEKQKTEHSILCPTNPYAGTKAGAELIAQSYAHSFKMPIIITRGNNVYGPNQFPEKVIPRFIQQLKNGERVTIQGDGSCVRAFLHAYDTAKAFQCILEKGIIGEIYNIGCDKGMEYSIISIAEILIQMIRKTENYDEWIEYVEDRPFNDQRYYISNKKLRNLGWEITIDLFTGLNDLIKE